MTEQSYASPVATHQLALATFDKSIAGEGGFQFSMDMLKAIAETTHVTHYLTGGFYNAMNNLSGMMSDVDLSILCWSSSQDPAHNAFQIQLWSDAAVDAENPNAIVPVMVITQLFDLTWPGYAYFSEQDALRQFSENVGHWLNKQVEAHGAECVQAHALHEANKAYFQMGFQLTGYSLPDDPNQSARVSFQKNDVKIEIEFFYKSLAMSIKEQLQALMSEEASLEEVSSESPTVH